MNLPPRTPRTQAAIDRFIAAHASDPVREAEVAASIQRDLAQMHVPPEPTEDAADGA